MNEMTIDEKIKAIEQMAKKARKWALVRFEKKGGKWTPVYRRMDGGMEFAQSEANLSDCVENEYLFWKRL